MRCSPSARLCLDRPRRLPLHRVGELKDFGKGLLDTPTATPASLATKDCTPVIALGGRIRRTQLLGDPINEYQQAA